MNKINVHYLAAAGAIVAFCLYITPTLHSANDGENTTKPEITETVHVYGYPHDGPTVNPISGYIAVYYAIQKLGYMPDTIHEYIKKAKKKIVTQRQEKKRPLQNGDWLHADEIAYLIDIDTPEKDRVRVIDDLGVVTVSEHHTTHEYQRALAHLQSLKKHIIGAKKDVRVLVIDKTFEPGEHDTENTWFTVIINKDNGTMRYVVIDPENSMQEDDQRIKKILEHLG